MIDTVRFSLFSAPFKSLPFGWEVKEGTRIDEDRVVPWRQCQHKETGLRIYGTDGMAQSLEVSLPRLMYGSNGILLRLADMNTAYRAALDLASEAVVKPEPEKVTRYDLTFHFYGAACDFVAALKGLGHRRVRNKQVEYFETGLEWPGKNVYIRLYDKQLSLSGTAGMIQRLEFQLRGNALRDVWTRESGFDSEACYKQYRDLCDGFRSRPVPHLSSVNALLVFLKENNVRVKGIDPVDRYLAAKSRPTRYRINRDLNSVRLQYFHCNFTSNLPEISTDITYLDCIVEPASRDPLAGVDAA